MFTGLVQDVGTVERVLPGPMTTLWIRTALGASEFAPGESIAVSGACLTVVEREGDHFRVDASPETLRRTTLGELRSGSRVNLERALRLSDRLGGHLVLGHVDGVLPLLSRAHEGGSLVLEIGLTPELAPLFIEKGSVTLDGVSLTVNTRGRRPVQRAAHSRDATAHHAGRSRARRTLQRRSGRHRQVRRAAPRRSRSGENFWPHRGHAPIGRLRSGLMARRLEEVGRIGLVERAIAEIRRGRMVILTDDEDRENEGDLVMAAEKVTPTAINFMAMHGRGPHLPVPDRGPHPPARAPADGAGQHLALRHRLHRLHRGGARRHHRHLRRGPGAHHPRRRRAQGEAGRPRPPGARLPAPRARRAACWSAPDRPRARSTSRAWPACSPRASSAR